MQEPFDFTALNVKISKNSQAEKQVKSYLLAYPSPFYALLKQCLSAPLELLCQSLAKDSKIPRKSEEWCLSRELPKAIVNLKKQPKARYFGCTAYFTGQSWGIVMQNIRNFTDRGDVVLDSFGGSGVTAIEAMMNGRIGIHTDLNPLSIFMTKALSAKVALSALYDLSGFESLKPKSKKEAKEIAKSVKYYFNALDSEFGETATQKEQDSTLWIPQDETLPKGSDVDSVLGLFSKKQQELESVPSNLFYQSYFYPLENVIKDFSGSMISQRENGEKTDSLLQKINGEKIFEADATDLEEIESQSVDFIYADSPYGAKIPYLDLSTMWNVWLDLPVDNALKEKECIVC